LPVDSLREVSLLQLGPAVQVVGSNTEGCDPFDFLSSVNG